MPQAAVCRTGWVVLAALAVSGRVVSAQSVAADPWYSQAWPQRAAVQLPAEARGLVRVALPAEISAETIRCLATRRGRTGPVAPLPHWTQSMEMTEPVRLAAAADVHYGFPRMVKAANGDLLLLYRVGTSHASDDSAIALRISTDEGQSWSDERILWRDQAGTSAHNPVALVTPSGRIVLWVSRYEYSQTPAVRRPCLWSTSEDHGRTWSEFRQFDASSQRSCYYMTDAIVASDGLLAANATFPPGGVGACYTTIWHSADDGQTWTVRSNLTAPQENLGDEVALLETTPGTILCLLRDRRRQGIWRLWSVDGGRTWSPREQMVASLGLLQRPLLTRLDDHTLLLTGRDAKGKQVVAYVSRDNGQSFGQRQVLDQYRVDGAYTAAARLGADRILLCWYSDGHTQPGKPDILLATLSLRPRPVWLWIDLAEGLKADETLYVYHGADGALAAEERSGAVVRPAVFVEGRLAEGQRLAAEPQQPQWQTLFNRRDLSGWRRPTGQWQVVGSVAPAADNPARFAAEDGLGTLYNGPAGKTVHLVSEEEHGDIEARLVYTVAEKSNSGIYFQGRYEIQILDSHAVEHPKYSDNGGIYQRWKDGQGYEGHAPRENASLPPGQWQTLEVVFRAPRFDAHGRKTAPARFERVVLNGKLIHENVAVSGPTRGSMFDDESAAGPIMIQGDHGPVALGELRIRPLAAPRP